MSKGAGAIPRKKRFSNKQLAIVAIILAVVIVLASIVSSMLLQTPNKFSLNAAIVDQLESQFPNEAFNQTAFSLLTDAGFNVSYYKGEEVNVTFYRDLAKRDFGIIILRSHFALREDNQTVDLFTSEEYKENVYSWEQRNGLLTKGNYSFVPDKFYFAITPKFISNLAGRFPRSIIIAMGCWSLKLGSEDLAKAFIDKGAIAYIGWTNIVTQPDTDHETAKLLELLCKQNVTMASAVNQAKIYSYRSGGLTVQSRMNLYPPSSWNITLSQLIQEARNSRQSATVMSLEYSFSLFTNVVMPISKDFLTD